MGGLPVSYTAAEVAALRTMMGLSMDGLADALGVNPRTVRSWESGRDRMSESAAAAVAALADEHMGLVRAMVNAGTPVQVHRVTPEGTLRPRGWFLAAAGRALQLEPDLEVDWV